jgi:hypothetical protein
MYPDVNVDRLFSGEKWGDRWQNMQHHLDAGIELNTHFSGMGCGEDSLLYHIAAMKNKGLRLPHGVESTCVSYHASDINITCRDVLMCRPWPHQPKIILGDIETRITPHPAIVELKATRSTWACMADYHAEHLRLLKLHMDYVINPDATSYCYIKKELVPVWSEWQRMIIDDRVPRGTQRPLILSMGGSPCTPYSPRGSQQKQDHNAMSAFNVYMRAYTDGPCWSGRRVLS